MAKNKHRALDIFKELQKTYPQARCTLNHQTPFELLIATLLSAQCTDKRVNMITAKLFANYNTPQSILTLTLAELEEKIRECGLYHNKSKAILATCRLLLEKHGGEVPHKREELESLPGIGRKTAGVVLGIAFGQATFPVDTHVQRVSYRLGISSGKNLLTTEKELMSCFSPNLWQPAHHLLIAHGRKTCQARNPKCEECPLTFLCPCSLGGKI